MKLISVFEDAQAKVDDEFYDQLKGISWHLTSSGYPRTCVYCEHHPTRKSRVKRHLHQVVIALSRGLCICDNSYVFEGLQINHKNWDKLDARAENLELISKERNDQMKRKQAHHTSVYRGVSWNRQWVADIRIDGKRIHLGHFNTQEAAALAYNQYIIDHNLDRELNVIKAPTPRIKVICKLKENI